jgi:hypothetical protein
LTRRFAGGARQQRLHHQPGPDRAWTGCDAGQEAADGLGILLLGVLRLVEFAGDALDALLDRLWAGDLVDVDRLTAVRSGDEVAEALGRFRRAADRIEHWIEQKLVRTGMSNVRVTPLALELGEQRPRLGDRSPACLAARSPAPRAPPAMRDP